MQWVEGSINRIYSVNKPARILCRIVILGIVSWLIMVGRNIGRIIEIGQIPYLPPDIFFYAYLITIVVGILVMYRLHVFWKEIGSIDYLMISFYVFGTSVSLFIFQFWADYISPWAANLGTYSCPVQDFNCTYFVWPEIFYFRQVYFWATLGLIIHSINFHGWSNYPRWLRYVIFVLLLNYLLMPILDLFWISQTPGLVNTTIEAQVLAQWHNYADIWGLVSLSGFGVNRYVANYLFASLLLGYNYLSIKTVIWTKEVILSRIGWIIFAVAQSANWIFQLVTQNLGLGGEEYFEAFQAFLLGSMISNLMIFLVILFIPETFLLSEIQIHQAKKLFKLTPESEASGVLSVFNFKNRLSDYVNALPPEMAQDILLKEELAMEATH